MAPSFRWGDGQGPLTAFATGQAVEGAGVPFLVAATTLWAAWNARRRGMAGLS